mmetsp:Transcript_5159/g.13228  ORF Transcript_5159/g.13228 Transcript_5159/m.13228 type:complete len:324 (+) Transcript_5159:491-1462(+)
MEATPFLLIVAIAANAASGASPGVVECRQRSLATLPKTEQAHRKTDGQQNPAGHFNPRVSRQISFRDVGVNLIQEESEADDRNREVEAEVALVLWEKSALPSGLRQSVLQPPVPEIKDDDDRFEKAHVQQEVAADEVIDHIQDQVPLRCGVGQPHEKHANAHDQRHLPCGPFDTSLQEEVLHCCCQSLRPRERRIKPEREKHHEKHDGHGVGGFVEGRHGRGNHDEGQALPAPARHRRHVLPLALRNVPNHRENGEPRDHSKHRVHCAHHNRCLVQILGFAGVAAHRDRSSKARAQREHALRQRSRPNIQIRQLARLELSYVV